MEHESASDGVSYREEIENALEQDDQRIGDVWRTVREQQSKNPNLIAEKLNLGPTARGMILQLLKYIETLREAVRQTDTPTTMARIARVIHNFIKRHPELSEDTKARLEKLKTEHEQLSSSIDAIAKEEKEIEEENAKRSEGIPGIYVYSLPHYLKYPVEPTEDEDGSNPRTYLKIGMSETDMKARVQRQATTALPEPLIMLRQYTCSDKNIKQIEEKIHRHLNNADHNQNRKRGSGKEWFLTHLTFIDSTADLLGLNVEYKHPDYST